MAELGKIGVKRILITGKEAPKKQEQPQVEFLSELTAADRSSKEIYFRWLSRLVLLCAIISLSFFLSSSLVIFRLAPEVIVEPLLIIRQSDSQSMVRYEPITVKMPSIRQLTEMFIKQYVIMRNTVVNDEDEMRTRWGPGGIVYCLSAPDVYRDFVGANINSVNKMFDPGYSSEVKIDNLKKEGESGSVWIVEFTIFNLSKARGKDGSLVLKTKRYRVSITPKFIPERQLYRARLINPLGFTVMKYNQSEIRN